MTSQTCRDLGLWPSRTQLRPTGPEKSWTERLLKAGRSRWVDTASQRNPRWDARIRLQILRSLCLSSGEQRHSQSGDQEAPDATCKRRTLGWDIVRFCLFEHYINCIESFILFFFLPSFWVENQPCDGGDVCPWAVHRYVLLSFYCSLIWFGTSDISLALQWPVFRIP